METKPDPAPAPASPAGEKKWWLDDPKNVKKLLKGFYSACAVVIVVGVFARHGHYELEEVPAFYAVYGFVGCTVIVLAARAARPFLMRGEDYYDR